MTLLSKLGVVEGRLNVACYKHTYWGIFLTKWIIRQRDILCVVMHADLLNSVVFIHLWMSKRHPNNQVLTNKGYLSIMSKNVIFMQFLWCVFKKWRDFCVFLISITPPLSITLLFEPFFVQIFRSDCVKPWVGSLLLLLLLLLWCLLLWWWLMPMICVSDLSDRNYDDFFFFFRYNFQTFLFGNYRTRKFKFYIDEFLLFRPAKQIIILFI